MSDLRTPRMAPRMTLLLLAGALGASCKTDREVLTIGDASVDAALGEDAQTPREDGSAETLDGPRGPFDVLPSPPDTPSPWSPEGGPPDQPDLRYEDGPPPPRTAEGWTQQDLGEVDQRTAIGQTEQAATIAVDGTGSPVVAFQRGAQIYVVRLVDGGWRDLPGINEVPMRPSSEPQVLIEADGGPTVAWVARDLQNVKRLHVDNYVRNRWDSVGGSANAEGTAHPTDATTPRLVQSSAGRVLAWLTLPVGGDRLTLVVTRLDGAVWTALGEPFTAGPGPLNPIPALAGYPGRPPVVAWTKAGSEAVVELWRWNGVTSTWDALPPVSGVRGPIALAESSGAIYLAAGAPTVLRLRDGDSAWTPIGRPSGAIDVTGASQIALATTPDDRVAMTWTTEAGAIALGYWKAGQWVQVTEAANSLRAGAGPNLAIDPASGRVYVVWWDQSDDRQKVRAAAFSPAP
jgi:hypothetical protein